MAYFLRDNLPPRLSEKVRTGKHLTKQDMEEWHAILNGRGWLANHWPAEYGGTGWSVTQKYIFEVEVALGSHEAVESAAAYGVPDEDGSLHIEATVTVRAGREVTSEALRAYVATSLPRYAIPLRFDIIDAMPRTSTGKIDRRELARRAAGRVSVGERV